MPDTEQLELFTQPSLTNAKRLLLEYVNGDWAGIHQIIGAIVGDPPPQLFGPLQVGSAPVVEFASLIRVRERFVHYREVVDRSKLAGRFDDYMPGNRVGDFDANQT